MNRPRVAAQAFAFLLFVLLVASRGLAEKKPPAKPLNLNTATVEQLEQLPGVGPRTAQEIVKFREKSGPFRRVEDLLAIRGITKRRLEKLRPYVTVTPPAAPPKQKSESEQQMRDMRGTAKSASSLQHLVCRFLRGEGKGNLVGDFEPVALKRHDFARMVREDADRAQSQVAQNLRADAALTLYEPLAAQVLIELAPRVEPDPRELACGVSGQVDLKTSSRVVEIDEDAAFFARDRGKGLLDDFVAIAAC